MYNLGYKEKDGEGITYEYDSDGNNIRIHYPDGGCERMFYDAEGNRIKHVLSEAYDVQEDDGEGWSYTYDNENRMRRMYTQYEYDTDGNIIHLRMERPDGTAFSDWQYEYDLNGNRTLKAGSFADAEDKLCGMVIRYQYDRMDRLTEESHDGEAVGYSYDPCGNRIKRWIKMETRCILTM